MAFSRDFVSARITVPHMPTLLSTLRTICGPNTSVSNIAGTGDTYTITKSLADFTPSEITNCQNAVDNSPAYSPQLQAQFIINDMPIFEKAIYLTIIDETNRLRKFQRDILAAIAAATSLADLKTRAGQINPLVDVTTQMAIQAVNDKAGTL